MKNRLFWVSIYKGYALKWGVKPDHILEQYASLVPKGHVLDVGAGEGRNAIFFAKKGYPVEAVDISTKALGICRKLAKKMKLKIKTEVVDLKKIEIVPEKYSLIICAWVLNFFKKKEIAELIRKMKKGVKKNGILYIVVFSTEDPSFAKHRKKLKMVEKNTFYSRRRKSYIHYFTRKKLISFFKDFTTIYCIEGMELDIGHGAPHHHSIVQYVGQKQ
jgi:tellurite methyltransferase